VLKFGGAALADGPAVERACDIVLARRSEDGSGPVVVVSAHLGVTDLLEEVARSAAAGRLDPGPVRVLHRSLLSQLELPADLLDRYWRSLTALLEGVRQRGHLEVGELDQALSFGERLSARIVARALARQGVPATPVDAWDLGLVTDSQHGRARPLGGLARTMRAALGEVPGVPVVTGFLAKDRAGNLTTLGRDGSDLTAALIAEAIDATELQYWKSVPGILTADPTLVPQARTLDEVTYAEAGELAFHGARVLHPAAVAPARRAKVPVRVASILQPRAPGTRFRESLAATGPRAVASRAEVLAIRLEVEEPGRRGAACARLFAVLEACAVTPTLTSVDDGVVEALVPPGPGVPAALSELGAAASIERGLATLALIGEGVGRDPALCRAILADLEGAGIEVRRLQRSSRGASLALAVDQGDLVRAVRVLHGGLPTSLAAQN
jgi:aspartate kinase